MLIFTGLFNQTRMHTYCTVRSSISDSDKPHDNSICAVFWHQA